MLVLLRGGGVAALTVPFAAARRLRPPRGVVRFVVFSGVADAAAFGSYIYAAKTSGVVVPAVLSSQYAAVAAILAALTFGERLTRVQLAGVVAILAAVAVVTAVQA
jgi:drug/metabolite transporter (DMT)-like permease